MISVPQARASRLNSSLRRNAGHFGEQEAGAAERSLTIMSQMKVIGTPAEAEYIAIGDTATRF